MFTIKISPHAHPFDVIAIAADQYKKSMHSQGYDLWYTPYGKPEVWQGVGLHAGDVAYIENAAGKTIDKVEGYASNVAPLANGDHRGVLSDAQELSDEAQRFARTQEALSTLNAGAFTQRSELPA